MTWGQKAHELERGWVYFIQAGEYVKIGFCRCDPKGRLLALQTGCPLPMRLLAARWGTFVTEKKIHKKLRQHHHQGEWFHLNDEVRAYIGASAKSRPKVPMESTNTATFSSSITLKYHAN